MTATMTVLLAGGMYATDAMRVVGARRFIGENIVFGYGYRDVGDRVLTATR
jgi:hypothetical protein